MLQPAAQRAESRQPQPAAQPATSLRTERATRVTECVRCSLFEHTSVRPRRSASALPPANFKGGNHLASLAVNKLGGKVEHLVSKDGNSVCVAYNRSGGCKYGGDCNLAL
jgi:hypothetical protein